MTELFGPFAHLAANHLWQSTGSAAVAVLLALALRANHARARYWLWLAASVKFLVPFSALAAIGGSLGRWFAPVTPVSRVPLVVEKIVQPFSPVQDVVLPSPVSTPATATLLPTLLLALWFCGFAAVLLYGWVRWRRVAAAVRSSTPLTEGRELEAWGRLASCPSGVRLVSSTAKLEPGVFGIFSPVLWLPAGIGDRLDDAELEAILAHELCHVRRRDNLLSAIHMAVESIFWFHPLVWWLGARLEEERERACDEEVVRMGGAPQIYAESILKVCEFYLASPVTCAAGVTGGELKKRIEGIMANRFTGKLSYGKKILLAVVAMLAVGAPMVVGVLHPPRLRAQPRPAFEVVSIRSAPPFSVEAMRSGQIHVGVKVDGAMADFGGQSLMQLICRAYRAEDFQVTGPNWMGSARFDIVAKLPEGASPGQVPEMLQTMLEVRFGLTLHREEKEFPVYALVVGKDGLKLKHPPDYDPAASAAATTQPFDSVIPLLTSALQRPVIDQTGLKGDYSLPIGDLLMSFNAISAVQSRMEDAARAQAEAAPPGPDTFQVIRNWGLQLEPRKLTLPVLVIDHIERTPTEN
jgi:uncharacterized protein (TIGR03435 family)